MKNPSLQNLMGIISMFVLLLSGCGGAVPATEAVAASHAPATSIPSIPPPTTIPTTIWFGMNYPADAWHAETVEENFLFYGLLTNNTLPHCQIMVLAEDPVFLLNTVPEFTSYESRNWLAPTREQKTTDRLTADLLTIKDEAGEKQLVYYEVFDNTGFFGYSEYRLGFFAVSRNFPDPVACAEAFWDVLITLDVAQWIPLPVGQG